MRRTRTEDERMMCIVLVCGVVLVSEGGCGCVGSLSNSSALAASQQLITASRTELRGTTHLDLAAHIPAGVAHIPAR
eukprot:752912-Rhodomonas_salina.1